MNDRERFHAVMNFEKPDRPIHWENLRAWQETLERWYDEGLPKTVIGWDQINNQRSFDEYFGMDLREEPPVFWEKPIPAIEKEIIEEDDHIIVYRNETGTVMRETKNSVSMPQFLKFPVENMKDWEELKQRYDGSDPVRYYSSWDAWLEKSKNRTYPIYCAITGFFGQPRNFMGEENICISYYTQPELIHAINEHWLNFNMQVWEKALSALEFDYALIWEDMSYKNGPMISPAMFDEFMAPYYRRLIDFLKSHGIKHFVVDTDGDVRKMIPKFLDVGVTAMYPWECTNGQDIRDVRKQYGKKLGIIGGLDKKALIEGKDAIEKEITGKIPFMLETGGYIASFDHGIPVDVPYENYLYYIKRLKEICI